LTDGEIIIKTFIQKTIRILEGIDLLLLNWNTINIFVGIDFLLLEENNSDT